MINIKKAEDYLKKNGFTFDDQGGGKWDYTNGPYVVPYVVEDLNWYEDHIGIFSDLIIINDFIEDDPCLADSLRTNSKSTDVRTYREFVVEIEDFIKKYHEKLKELKKWKIEHICKEEL